MCSRDARGAPNATLQTLRSGPWLSLWKQLHVPPSRRQRTAAWPLTQALSSSTLAIPLSSPSSSTLHRHHLCLSQHHFTFEAAKVPHLIVISLSAIIGCFGRAWLLQLKYISMATSPSVFTKGLLHKVLDFHISLPDKQLQDSWTMFWLQVETILFSVRMVALHWPDL